MADEIQVAGEQYISSKRASDLTGYAQDYIGQLARKRLVDAKRIGGLWYISQKSLMEYKEKADAYKPEPPQYRGRSNNQDIDSVVSFDGKDYISAPRAAEITGYHQDYVGQLARSGKVLSRQIGNRWYVERGGLVAHKKEKDTLLAAVQSEAVGITRPDAQATSNTPQEKPFFTYFNDTADLFPPSESEDNPEGIRESSGTSTGHRVPIRVFRESSGTEAGHDSTKSQGLTQIGGSVPAGAPHQSRIGLFSWIFGSFAAVVLVLSVSYVFIYSSRTYATLDRDSLLALGAHASGALVRVGDLLERLLTTEIVARNVGR